MPDKYGRATTNELFTSGFRGETVKAGEKRRKKEAAKRRLKKSAPKHKEEKKEKKEKSLLDKLKDFFTTKPEQTGEKKEADRAERIRRLRKRKDNKRVPNLGVSSQEAEAIRKGFK